MNLYFDKLDIVTFKAYRTPVSLKLERMGLGLWFVSGVNEVNKRIGSNGAGKSSIFDCACWVLYGRTVQGHRTPDVVNWRTGEAPEATLHLSIDDERHEVRRVGKTSGLYLDGKTVTQETIDELVGLTFVNFLHTVILGQGRPLFFDLTPAAKMDVLSETMNLDKWDVRIKRARDLVGGLDMQWVRLDAEAKALARNISRLQEQADDLKAKADNWKLERQNTEAKRAAEIKNVKQWLEEATLRLGDADLAYDGAETELRASKASAEKARRVFDDLLSKQHRLRIKRDDMRDKEKDLLAEMKSIAEGDDCPTCGQSLKGTALDKHRKRMKDRLANIADDRLEAEAAWEAAKYTQNAAEAIVSRHNEDIDTFFVKSNNAIDERTRAQNRCNELTAELRQLNDRQDESEAERNPYVELLQDVRKQTKDAVAAEQDVGKDMKRIDKGIAANKYWVEGFKLLRLQLIDELLAELEGVTQTLIASVGLDDWRVEYAIDKETKSGTTKAGLNVSIFQPEYDQPIKWELFSGGELQRLRLIGAVALSQVLLRRANVRCELLVLDEPSQHLSPEGVRDVVEFLVELGRDAQVFFVDHQAIESRNFTGRVEVRRTREDGATFSVA